MSEHDQRLIQKHEIALFGDGNGRKGIVDKIDEMYSIFNGTKTFGKIIMYLIVTIGAVTVGINQIKDFISQFFAHRT